MNAARDTADVAVLAKRQASILDTCRSLEDLGVPRDVLAPIRRWACIDMWLAAAPVGSVSGVPGPDGNT